MCFTPFVSLLTAIIEFAVATIILIKYKNYLVPAFSAILIYSLGIYQITEFMLCLTNNPFLWAKLGFITYTFLPAIWMHFALRFLKKPKNKFYIKLIYFPPIVFSIIALLKDNFITGASCERVFVIVKTIFVDSTFYEISNLYLIYYFGYILFILILFIKAIKTDKNDLNQKINKLWAVAGTITILLPVLLILILPSLSIQFPSIYCEFSLGFALVAYFGSYLYDRKKKKELLVK